MGQLRAELTVDDVDEFCESLRLAMRRAVQGRRHCQVDSNWAFAIVEGYEEKPGMRHTITVERE